jgi:hypothetical protein
MDSFNCESLASKALIKLVLPAPEAAVMINKLAMVMLYPVLFG